LPTCCVYCDPGGRSAGEGGQPECIAVRYPRCQPSAYGWRNSDSSAVPSATNRPASYPKSRKDTEFENVDIEDYKLLLLDAYIFATPEYNHATSAALENAIDFLSPRMEQQSGGICRIWRRWQCPSGGELEASDTWFFVIFGSLTDSGTP
jgi:hypothetical protein